MTSLLPGRPSGRLSDRLSERRPGRRPGRRPVRRPVTLIAGLGGAAAAASTLVVCLAVGVIGWFLADAGAHGAPRDGLRVGALGWLLGHGSGVRVDGVAITVVPLGITAICAWTTWRLGHRVGELLCGHGPDADGIADGQRDWTVPVAAAAFALGYAAVALLTCRLAGTPETALSQPRVVLWSLLLCAAFAAPALAIGAGRLAIWAPAVAPWLRAAVTGGLRIAGCYALVSAALFLVALLADFGAAVNMMSRLHLSAGDATVYTAVTATLAPNAAVFAGSYVLGPGFAVGTGTLVSPSLVSLGPLPMFPLLAALPDNGPTPAWTAYAVALPPLVALAATVWVQRRQPTLRWEEGALRGCVGGVLAGLITGILAALSGGAAGPGRMRTVGPEAVDVLVHAITAFGLGGLLGGLLMTAWQRHAARRHVAEQQP